MNNPKIKILFLINTLTGGGAEKVLVDLVNNLNPEKYDVTVQTVFDKGVNKKYLKPEIRYKTINRFQSELLTLIWGYLVSFVLPARLIYRIFIKENYDYEVAFLEGVPTKLIAASTNINSKKYAWVHTDMSMNYGLEKVFKTLEDHKRSYKQFENIFCVSESVKEGFIKLFGWFENLSVIYNPVDNINILSKANETLIEVAIPDCIKFVAIGRLTEQKGFERLLTACNKLVVEKYNFSLWVLGEGEQREVLEKYILNNNLQNHVFLLGFHENPYKFIKAANYFVSSSYTEGFSTVVTESVIIGTPVITTDCAGMKEILGESEFGLIVPNSTEGLYEGLKKLLTNKEIYLKYNEAVKKRKDYFQLSQRMKEIETEFK
ncbi:glycosyltransferase [Chryseobacterium salivictor]|nr:glycosyltransferase [Chryseobacterium salivictor]